MFRPKQDSFGALTPANAESEEGVGSGMYS